LERWFERFVRFKKLNIKNGSKGYVKEMFKPLLWLNGLMVKSYFRF
jgi:hypothetical protein